MNKILKMALVSAFLATLTANSAGASLFDWNSAKNSDHEGINWSFDRIYDILKYSSDTNQTAIIGETYVVGVSSHITPKVSNAVNKTYEVLATGYSSTIDQTDDTPFITASGTYVRDGVVATNFLPIGTLIKIPQLYGDKIFIVEDRMNSRYKMNIDLWFPEREMAKNFGVKRVKIEIVS